MSAAAPQSQAQPRPSSSSGYYYDPHSRCIKCDPALAQDDGTLALRGIVVKVEDDDGRMVSSSSLQLLQPGSELIGEIIDVIDLDADEMKSSEEEERRNRMRLTRLEGGLLSPSFVKEAMRPMVRETPGDDYDPFPVISKTLIQRQRQLQSAHAQEYQRLLYKQKKDWLWFHQHHLGEDRLLELLAVHQKESMELHSLHQSEQNEMIDFVIFKCMLPLTTKNRGRQQRQQRRQARVAQKQSTSTLTDEIIVPPSSVVSTRTEKVNAPSPVSVQTDPITGGLDSAIQRTLPVTVSTDRQKADEIKAVVRDRSITREERQVKSAEMKQKYASSVLSPMSLTDVKQNDNDRGHNEPRGTKKARQESNTERFPNLPDFKYQKGSKSDQDGEDEPLVSAQEEGIAVVTNAKGPSRRKTVDVTKYDCNNLVEAGTGDSGDDDVFRDDEKEQASARMALKKAVVKIKTTNQDKAVGHPEAMKEGEEPKTSSGYEFPLPSKDKSKIYSIEQSRDVENKVGDDPQSSSHRDATNTGGAIAISVSAMTPKPSVIDTPNDPLGIATDRTPMKKLIKRIESNDPSLVVLKLDGRKQVKEDDWQALFESLARNSSLTHLSICRCEINDSLCTALIPALKENAMLVEIRLNSNKGLTDDTGKGLVKILSTNSTLKHVGVVRTSISKKVAEELKKALEKRNSIDKSSIVQDERQKKIKELLSYSAGDKAGKELATEAEATKRRNSSANNLSASRENSLNSKPICDSITIMDSWTSKKSTSSNDEKKIENGRRRSVRSSEVTGKRSSHRGSDASGMKESLSRRGSDDSSMKGSLLHAATENGRRQIRSKVRPDAHRGSMLRASITAKTMAQLGEDINVVGVDITKLREQRKFRGECETCGRKCYTKTLFKTTPLTIPNLVENGRCLKCDP